MAFSKARRLSDFIAADGSIPTGKFASSTITSAHLVDGTVAHADLHTNMDLTGKTVLVSTQSASDNDTSAASTAYVTTAIANLVDSAPGTMNTLNEIAAALNDDANFNTTVTNAIAAKLPLAGGTMTGALVVTADANPSLEVSRGSANTTNVNLKYNTTLTGQLSAANEKFQISAAGSGTEMEFYTNGTKALEIDTAQNSTFAGNVTTTYNIQAGAYKLGSTVVMNSGRNLTNIGTISSGAITSTGDFLINESANTERSVRIQNSTVTGLFGVEGSSANRFVGSAANNMFLGTTTEDGIEFATNNTVRATISSSGAFTLTGNMTFGDGHTIGDDVDDNLEIASSANENLILKSAGELLLRTNGNTNALVLDNSQDATFAGSVTIQDGSTDFTMSGDSSNNTYFISNGEFRIRPSGTTTNKFVIGSNGNLTTAGHLYTSGSATSDIGQSSNYWRDAYIQDVYTQDLHLSNEDREKGGNDIDGTKGNWTIQEGEENLYIINNKTGKKFKFALEEVS